MTNILQEKEKEMIEIIAKKCWKIDVLDKETLEPMEIFDTIPLIKFLTSFYKQILEEEIKQMEESGNLGVYENEEKVRGKEWAKAFISGWNSCLSSLLSLRKEELSKIK